jgi:hypothetical protein
MQRQRPPRQQQRRRPRRSAGLRRPLMLLRSRATAPRRPRPPGHGRSAALRAGCTELSITGFAATVAPMLAAAAKPCRIRRTAARCDTAWRRCAPTAGSKVNGVVWRPPGRIGLSKASFTVRMPPAAAASTEPPPLHRREELRHHSRASHASEGERALFQGQESAARQPCEVSSRRAQKTTEARHLLSLRTAEDGCGAAPCFSAFTSPSTSGLKPCAAAASIASPPAGSALSGLPSCARRKEMSAR